MAESVDRLRSLLQSAHADGLRVHDSPIRADQLFREVERIAETAKAADLSEEQQARVQAALADALRVLRRDDDGREAARHIQTATGQLEKKERKPSPFLDDL